MKIRYALLLLSFTILAFLIFLKFHVPSHLTPIPLIITPSGSPAVLVKIEEKPYLLKIDLGSKFQVSLKKNVLESIKDKKSCRETVKWRDAKGNFYESPTYNIPNLKIGDLILKNVTIKEDNETYDLNTTLWKDRNNHTEHVNQTLGTLGRPLLEKTNLLFDFQKSEIVACNEKQKLKKMGYFLNNTVQVPFKDGKKGIIIEVDTDIGILRLGLDTGATITLVRSSLLQDKKISKEKHGFFIFNSAKFSILDKDFGHQNLFLFDITNDLSEIDGMLGMDFLKNHTIYIDYQDKFIYIGN